MRQHGEHSKLNMVNFNLSQIPSRRGFGFVGEGDKEDDTDRKYEKLNDDFDDDVARIAMTNTYQDFQKNKKKT